MPRVKVLKSVAHSIANSFASSMNYGGYDYAMGILLEAARKSRDPKVFIDLLSGEASPVLKIPPLQRKVQQYTSAFRENLVAQGSSLDLVASARLELDFDLAVSRDIQGGGYENPYVCRVLLFDHKGKDHSAAVSGWWYPEEIRDNLQRMGSVGRVWAKLKWFIKTWWRTMVKGDD